MKQLLVVALVVVVVFTGVPVAIGMPMADCADCELGLVAASCILAVLAAAVVLAAARRTAAMRTPRQPFLTRLLAGGLERPPRLA